MDLLEPIDISIITVGDSFSIRNMSISISLKLDYISGFIFKGKNEFLSVGGKINISILIDFSELNIFSSIFFKSFSILILIKNSLDLMIIFGKVLKFSNKLLRTFEIWIVRSDIIFDYLFNRVLDIIMSRIETNLGNLNRGDLLSNSVDTFLLSNNIRIQKC
jgi:hypothetical protein